MKCGYCNKEMEKGQFTVPEVGFYWLGVVEKAGETKYIRPGKRIKNQYSGKFTILKLDGYYCETCKKIVIDSELEDIYN